MEKTCKGEFKENLREMAIINPYENREKTQLTIKRAEFVSRWAATITTSVGAAIWGHSQAMQYLPESFEYSQLIAWVVGAMFAAFAGWITDMAFGDILQRVVTDAIASKHPDAVAWNGESYFKKLRRAESIGFGIVLVLLFSFDIYTTLIIRDPVADQAHQTELADISAETQKINTAQKATTDPMVAQIAQLKKDISESEHRAATSNASLTKLAAEGNAWAKNQIAAKRSAASRASRAQLDKLTTAYAAALEGNQTALAETTKLINEQNQKKARSNELNRNIMAGIYTAFTIGPKMLSIILRVLMVISFFAYSSGLELDLNGDGVFDYADVEVYYAQMLRRSEAQKAKAHAAKSDAETIRRQSGNGAFQ